MNTRAVIGFPGESTPGDRRTLFTPTVAWALVEAGFTVIAEPGIATAVTAYSSEFLILAESHLVVSTWPEHELAHIDLFTCRADTDPEHARQR